MKASKFATALAALVLAAPMSLTPVRADAPPVNAPYRDALLSPAERAADLVRHMTLDEKIAQMRGLLLNPTMDFVTNRTFVEANAARFLGDGLGEFGFIRHPIVAEVELRNAIQRYLLEKTRLGIPLIFHDEGCHGLLAPEATSFPAPIGLACSWDEELVERIFSVTALEMRSRGIQHALTPVIDIGRDPRWGRTDETLGEDPFLNGKLGAAMVRGFQGGGSGRIEPGHVMATLKHFTGHGQPEGGINRATATVPLREILDAHVVPFRMVIAAAKPAAVMPSYNEVDGVPSHANVWLLQDVLRKEFGFQGLIVSDYGGVEFLERVHHVAGSPADAALLAFRAGVELNLPSGDYYRHLPGLVAGKQVAESAIDSAVKKVLRMKFEMGLFENPYAEAREALAVSRRPASRALALEAARKSIVLLKNQNALLPLAKNGYQTIAVIGPNANDTRLGSYSGEPWQKVTILEGIRAQAGRDTRVLHAEGCRLVKDLPASSMVAWQGMKDAQFTSEAENEPLIAEAVRTAREADLIVLVLGENEVIAREAWENGHLGDRASLELFGSQRQLADAIFSLGKRVVVYLMNGKPMDIRQLVDRAEAVIEGWYMGQETGTAAADILFGNVNPSGKLTISFPRSTGHIPAYYNHKPGARHYDFVDDTSKPLFPFGFGLSYTTFAYSPVRLSAPTLPREGQLTASVEVTNTGKVAGDEIVQLYLRDDVSSTTRPVQELRGFQRIRLKPGETRTVTLPITAESLAFHDIRMERVVEPGTFKVWMAPCSGAGEPASFEVVDSK